MHSSKLVRRASAAAVVVGLMVGGVSMPTATAARKTVSATKPSKARPSAAKFTASGWVTSVGADAMTVTLDYKGGNQRALRGTSLTVSVPASAKITRNDAAATLADVQVGDHVAVQGLKVSTSYVASMVHVDAPVPVVVEPTV